VLLATGVWLGGEVWWADTWFRVAVGAWVVSSALVFVARGRCPVGRAEGARAQPLGAAA